MDEFSTASHSVVNSILMVQAMTYLKLPNVQCSQLTNVAKSRRVWGFTQLAQQRTWPSFPRKLDSKPAASHSSAQPALQAGRVVQAAVHNQGIKSTWKLRFFLKNGLRFYFYLALLWLKQVNRNVQSLTFISTLRRLLCNNLAFLRKQKCISDTTEIHTNTHTYIWTDGWKLSTF